MAVGYPIVISVITLGSTLIGLVYKFPTKSPLDYILLAIGLALIFMGCGHLISKLSGHDEKLEEMKIAAIKAKKLRDRKIKTIYIPLKRYLEESYLKEMKKRYAKKKRPKPFIKTNDPVPPFLYDTIKSPLLKKSCPEDAELIADLQKMHERCKNALYDSNENSLARIVLETNFKSHTKQIIERLDAILENQDAKYGDAKGPKKWGPVFVDMKKI